MIKAIIFTIAGYLSGSVLYAQFWSRILGRKNMLEQSRDKNPGTANAFMYGGFWCGFLTLICDLLKGFLPVQLYLKTAGIEAAEGIGLAFVLAAPVIGHILPVFCHFRGGKGIAVTFGCLLGLLPQWLPLGFMIFFFLFFSLVMRVTPHFYRTLAAYISVLIAMLACFGLRNTYSIGFLLITAAVCFRMHSSEEVREKMGVKWLWTH